MTLETADGLRFKVGGTNTTSSIAASLFLLSLPLVDKLPIVLDCSEVVGAAERVVELDEKGTVEAALFELDKIERWVRVCILPRSLSLSIAKSVFEGGELLDLINESWGDALPTSSDSDATFERLRQLLLGKFLSEEVRCRILALISLVPSELAVESLAKAIGDSSPLIARCAALGLRAMEYEVRSLVASGSRAGSQFLDAICKLPSLSDPEARVYIVEAMGYFEQDASEASESLDRALLSDAEDHVRWAAAVALGRTTNPVPAVNSLTASLRTEQHARVRQAALLSLGRLLQRSSAQVDEFQGDHVDEAELLTLLAPALKAPAIGERMYAAYCLGELHLEQSAIADTLVKTLGSAIEFSFRAHLVLALWKQICRYGSAGISTDELRICFASAFDVPRPKNHPDTSYRDWFDFSALRVLARVDQYELAAKYASNCLRASRALPARSAYFEGIGGLFAAEAFLTKRNLRDALSVLEKAKRCFALASRSPTIRVPNDLGSAARLVASTRAMLASSRLEFLRAISECEKASFVSSSENGLVNRHLASARSALDKVVASCEVPLNEGELDFNRYRVNALGILEWQREIIQMAQQVEELRSIVARRQSADDIVATVQVLYGMIEGRLRLLAPVESAHIKMQQEGLLGTVTQAYNELIENRRTIHAVATQLVSGLLLQLRLPLPVPDVDSRLLGEGRAAVEFISVADSKSIDLDGDSFEVPSSLINVKVRITVTVQLRCEGELLYLGYDIQKGLSGDIAIYVFEGSKVIDIDLPAWSAGVLELDLALYFVVGFRREYVHRKRLKLIRSSEN